MGKKKKHMSVVILRDSEHARTARSSFLAVKLDGQCGINGLWESTSTTRISTSSVILKKNSMKQGKVPICWFDHPQQNLPISPENSGVSSDGDPEGITGFTSKGR